MQTEPTRSHSQPDNAPTNDVTVCANCRANMPREMRFCRACGFRLGEGVAEFTETVRFQNPPRTAPPVATAASPKSNPFGQFNEWGTLARDIKQKVESATKHLEQKQRKQQGRKQKRHRSHWMSWMILIIIISAVSSGSLINSSGLRGLRDQLRGLSSASATRSWVGVNEFRTAEGGVTFDQVEPPDSPADKAGLVGGDVITSFDGQTIKNEGEIRKLLAATPTGKTVDVVYIRDGVTKTTKLTTISQAEMERLNDLAGERTDGFVGIGTDRERVQIPGTNTYGVQLNKIRQNNPADTAGIKNGDIIIEFAGVPIRTDEELESRTRRAAPGSMVTVVVMRDGQRLEIPVKVGTD